MELSLLPLLYNLNVGGDFSNNDSASNFTWRATDTLTVLGTASVVADSFNNSGNYRC